MKKIGVFIIIILIIVIVGGVLGRNIIAKSLISGGIKVITGLSLKIDRLNIGIFKRIVDVKGLKLYNPSEFSERIMVDIPRIYIDYDLGAFLEKKIHFKEVTLYLKEFIVVRDKKGKLNLDSLKIVQDKKAKTEPKERKEQKPSGFKIDILKLKIGKVVFKDYSKGIKPEIKEFNINIDETYKNITNPYSFVSLIVTKALMNTTIASIINFDLNILKDGISGILGTTTKVAVGIVDKTLDVGVGVVGKTKEITTEGVKKAADTIKNILPLGGDKK